MVGNNTLLLNEATMIAAVQAYFDDIFAHNKSPKVTAIEPLGPGEFRIKTTDPEKKKDARERD